MVLLSIWNKAMTSLARHKVASAERAYKQSIYAELQSLRPIYPVCQLPIHVQPDSYPSAISLVAHGCGAYLLKAHVIASVVSRVEQRIAELGFLERVQSGHFQAYRQGQEAVSLQTEKLGEGVILMLVSNSAHLLQALPDLSPPAPWQVFPDVDASGLGSLQGSLEHWWNHYWWPYWQNLTPQQRASWLDDARHPEGWREYVRLMDELNGTNREEQA